MWTGRSFFNSQKRVLASDIPEVARVSDDSQLLVVLRGDPRTKSNRLKGPRGSHEHLPLVLTHILQNQCFYSFGRCQIARINTCLLDIDKGRVLIFDPSQDPG